MTYEEIADKIKEAIRLGLQIKITYKYGISSEYIEQYINPYIYGSDIFQYEFVWAYIPYVKISINF